MDESVQNVSVTLKPNPLTTVTPLSKALALILFITLPFVGFYLGTKYQRLAMTPTQSVIKAPNPVSDNANGSFSNTNVTQPITSTAQTRTQSVETLSDANWKDFPDPVNKFYLRYPSDWTVKLNPHVAFISPDETWPKDDGPMIKGGELWVDIEKNVQGLSLEKWMDVQQSPSSQILRKEELEVDGLPAIRYVIVPEAGIEPGNDVTTTMVARGNEIYNFICQYAKPDKELISKICEGMILTIDFHYNPN